MADQEEFGTTEQFVIAKGFTQVRKCPALIGYDGTKRLFAELFADADRPDVRTEEAYRELFYSLQPGWTIRILQIFWPDPRPGPHSCVAWKNGQTIKWRHWIYCMPD